jgi:putative ABC transport system permease protein
MKLLRSLHISAGALLRHKLRTALALAGLVIGVAVVLVMVGVGEGAKRAVLQQIERLGTDMLVVTAGESRPTPGRQLRAGRVISLRLSDSDAIAAECASVARTAPAQSGARRIKFGRVSTFSTVLGTTPPFETIRNAPVVRGRYFTAAENAAARRVAIVGTTVVAKIFDNVDPLGNEIRIGAIPFEIIGILESKGTAADGSGDEDNQILVPIKTALRRVFNVDHLDRIYVQATDQTALQNAEADIRILLRDRHELDYLRKRDDFDIEDQALALRTKRAATGSFTVMIIGVASITLFVGAIGILSIMLITVKERVSEIGLRMAVGARPRDIAVQFLCEALMLGIAGGALGLASGLAVAVAIGGLTEWSTYVPPEWILAAMSASVLSGLAAGVYPALRAAHMNPIDALRAE